MYCMAFGIHEEQRTEYFQESAHFHEFNSRALSFTHVFMQHQIAMESWSKTKSLWQLSQYKKVQ